MENLDHLKELRVLNLSDNLIKRVEGIEGCSDLDTLYLGRNHIGKNGIEDLKGLLDCPKLSCIDL